MTDLLFGYNTNGFAHHCLEDTLVILAEMGYRSVAITLDHHVLNPFEPKELKQQRQRIGKLLEPLRSGAAIETGARFLLDPLHKHQPTLLSKSVKQRKRRLDFLRQAIETAAELEIGVVSFWSGTPLEDEKKEVLMKRLAAGCRILCDHAAKRRVRLAFEPEPGMFVDSMANYRELFERVDHSAFGLTIDVGHLHCQGETPIAPRLRKAKDILWNIHIEDMKRGVHDHLMFGEGEIDFAPVLRTLADLGYTGGVHVELSRHCHDAVATARRALEFLRHALASTR